MFEINLVPDVKAEMIKAQRVRNIVAFFSAAIGIVFAVVMLILGSIKGAQDINIKRKDEEIALMSETLAKFSNLDSFLTIQSQLKSLKSIADEKTLASRIFNFIWVFQPTNGDLLEYSEVNMDMNLGTISFDAQAKSADPNKSNYAVMEAFEQGVPMITFDYGRYVTAEGNEIPAVCIVETDGDGSSFTDDKGRLYARWANGVSGCNPDTNYDEDGIIKVEEATIRLSDVTQAVQAGYYKTINRTPKISEWYKEDGSGFMDSSGEIRGIEHFESSCIDYALVDGVWSSENGCQLIADKIDVRNKSNGMSDENGLMLMFKATIKLNPEVFLAKNKHMIAIRPSGYLNVTDSYLMITDLFSEAAAICDGRNCEKLEDK